MTEFLSKLLKRINFLNLIYEIPLNIQYKKVYQNIGKRKQNSKKLLGIQIKENIIKKKDPAKIYNIET